VIVLEKGEPTLKLMRWGLIPGWAKDESIGDKLINARAETVSEKTSFKKPFDSQRCLVVADGFYEWQLSGRGRTPFRFTMKDKSFFCMAGLWDRWVKPPARGEFVLDVEGDTPAPSRVVETFQSSRQRQIRWLRPSTSGCRSFWIPHTGKPVVASARYATA
jgi:putative SOS response-associated peptidase YedK